MFTFLEALFALWSIPFFLLLAVDIFIVSVLVEKEKGFWATVVAVGSIVGLDYIWKIPVLKIAHDHPWKVLLYIAIYFAAGTSWSFAKWLMRLHKKNRLYEDFKADFLTKYKVTALTGELAVKLESEIQEFNGHTYDDEKKVPKEPLNARHFKGDLIRWATYWPFSMLGFALNDVVRKAWTFIYELFQSTYQRLSNYVFRGAIADRELANQYRAEREAMRTGKGSNN